MKKIFMVFLLGLSLIGCNNNTNKDIKKLMKENEYVIIDVRTKTEYDDAHVIGAINIPYNEIDENVSLEKEKIIFVYCKSGTRSSIAYKNFTDLGYTVYDLGAYSQINLPKE